MPTLIDFCCGRWGWSKAFAKRGWTCIGIDLVEPPEIPDGCIFLKRDILSITDEELASWKASYLVASTPCEQFSVHGMRHFHPNPPYPEMGMKLFMHVKGLFERSQIPYTMENVRVAQQFVGTAVHHCGPFYLWGTGVPPMMPQGIVKGLVLGGGGTVLKMLSNGATRADIKEYRRKHDEHWNSSGSDARKKSTAMFATVPPELSSCVADYAERLCEVTA